MRDIGPPSGHRTNRSDVCLASSVVVSCACGVRGTREASVRKEKIQAATSQFYSDMKGWSLAIERHESVVFSHLWEAAALAIKGG